MRTSASSVRNAALRDNVEGVIDILRRYPHDKAFFNAVRKQSATIDGEVDVEVAAWFIYLNKVAFNGLYRVNQRGHFNVPYGKYKNPTICDEPALRACSEALQGRLIQHASSDVAVAAAKRGDFVYFDPPYLPLSATSAFTSYTADGFGIADHRRLRELALELVRRAFTC